MMKRVGILTFHYATNHGAVLQAYALYKTINSFPGCHADIINYVPDGYSYNILSNDCMTDDQRRKREKFNQFLFENCGICTPMVHSVTGNQYDLYLVGSDQVWNTELPEAANYEFFLPNLDSEAKRAAYSASIGMDIDSIDKELFRQYLPRFQKISVREKSYKRIISELSGKECEYTLDPAMLLKQRDYETLLEKTVGIERNYLLYFWYGNEESGLKSIETVNTLVRKYNLLVKHTFAKGSVIRKMLVNDGGYVFNAGIGEFLQYIKNARIVVTNSFHGAVFALLFEKPLYIFYSEKRKCRQENLVELFHLQNRVIQRYVCPDQLNIEMDYAYVLSILEKERERSLAFLRNIIETV